MFQGIVSRTFVPLKSNLGYVVYGQHLNNEQIYTTTKVDFATSVILKIVSITEKTVCLENDLMIKAFQDFKNKEKAYEKKVFDMFYVLKVHPTFYTLI